MYTVNHELEGDVDLLGIDVQVAQSIHRKDVDVGEGSKALAGRAIGKGGVYLVETTLHFDEQRPPAVRDGIQDSTASACMLTGIC